MIYTVKAGDSLSLIAKKFGQPFSNWKEIYNLNPDIGPNPDKIYPGQQLTIPESWSSQPQPSPSQEEQPIIKKSSGDTMNMIYIAGGLLLLYLAYKKKGRK